ncbi:MAG: thioesterase family protein [Microscillaceae bacterium]|jgi:acyl-CoA thioester hydrolase|nr:thioesterase family protein [Microscillaceae bacterium]
MIQDLLKSYTSVIELPVLWGDMDAALHVNNAMYLRYSESGRIAYMEKIGFRVAVGNSQDPIGPILAEINCRYKAPLTYPDTISVATRLQVETIEESSFEMAQIIVSHKLQRVVAEVRARLVSYNYQLLKKAPLPEALKEKMLIMEERQID